ncbi:MAG: hypothetical protein J7501_15715 [Bdellovibrio sp.]|nr:hypothetical protein [Bdellovibrio sp.]
MKSKILLGSFLLSVSAYAGTWQVLFSPSQSGINMSVVEFGVASDFSKALSLKQNQDPYTEAGDELFIDATVVDPSINKVFKAKVKARGNSVLSDGQVEFPKLKVEIDETENTKESLFSGQKKFRINTHLSDKADNQNSEFGRLLGGQGPLREGLAYKFAEVLGLVAPQTQFAKVRYLDTQTRKETIQSALVIETDKKMAKRLGAEIILDTQAEAGAIKAGFNENDAALFMVFHALVGNVDYSLKFHEPDIIETERYRAYWNTFLIKQADGRIKPVVYDLDLATMVNGKLAQRGQRGVNAYFGLNDPEIAGLVRAMAELRQKVSKQSLSLAVDRVVQMKDTLLNVIDASPVEAQGKNLAKKHLQIFLENSERALSYNVIAVEGANLLADSNDNAAKKIESLRPGTPVMILKEIGQYYQVAVLDLHGDLEENATPVGYVPKGAVATDLPTSLLGIVDNREM